MKWLRGFWKSSTEGKEPPVAGSGPFLRRGRVQVSVGLDFGTHSTKAAFLELGSGVRSVRALRFPHDFPLWPSFAYPAVGVVRDGRLVWGTEAALELEGRPWTDGIRCLKVLLAGSADASYGDNQLAEGYAREIRAAGVDDAVWRPPHVAAAALALQIAEVCRELRPLYSGREIDASFTIPVPIDHVQNSSVLATYRRVANTAHALVAGGRLRVPAQELVSAAAEEYANAPAEELPDGRVYTLPEAVAQTACYHRSLAANEGVHGVIDVGAGTTDLSIFYLGAPGTRSPIYWYGALAIPKAAAFVQSRVAQTMTSQGGRATEEAIVQQCGKMPGVVEQALEEIRHIAQEGWTDAYNHRRADSDWWDKNKKKSCPVFICGGGGMLPRAELVFSRPYVQTWPPHAIWSLPEPENYVGNGVPFDRMTVAYGLAIPKPEHGRYVLPKDCPDHTPPRNEKELGGMGGDQLTPTPGWLP